MRDRGVTIVPAKEFPHFNPFSFTLAHLMVNFGIGNKTLSVLIIALE